MCPSQSAITKDNISLTVDGVLYFRVLDPYKATYGVDDYVVCRDPNWPRPPCARNWARWSWIKPLKSAICSIQILLPAINQASSAWGVQVLRYEIKDIVPPTIGHAGDGGSDESRAGKAGPNPRI